MRLGLATGEWTSQKLPEATQYYASLHSIVLSSDGKSIIYVKMQSPGQVLRIFEYNLETGKEKELYRLKKPGSISGLCFSRDFRSLAFLQTEYGEQAEEAIFLLQVLDMESGKVHTAYSGPVELGEPVFSPDERDILVYCRDESGWQKGVGLVPAAGGDLRRLKLGMSWPRGADLNNRFISLDWSPDGKQIALTAWSIKEEMYLLKNVIPASKKK
jgi:Tol biopolymer transport system component